MDRETLVNIVYSGKVRFIPVRRCSLCDEYIGYKFVKMYNGSMSIGLMMKMRYVRSFIIISIKIDFIMRMGMCMLNH